MVHLRAPFETPNPNVALMIEGICVAMAVTVCATGAAYFMAIHVSKIARKRQQEVTSDSTSSFLSSKPNPSSSSIDDSPHYTEADHTSSAVVRDEEQSLPASHDLLMSAR